jgi:uncharacterized phage protein (TIGR01671 family)
MNREIKFRSWDESQKYMAYQGTPDLETIQSFMHHFGDKELMQFTGLLDCDGKEIFEGDIIEGVSYLYGYQLHENKQFKYNGVVKFQTQCDVGLCWVVDYGGGWWNLKQTVHRNSIDYSTGKVIGNVFENSELAERFS